MIHFLNSGCPSFFGALNALAKVSESDIPGSSFTISTEAITAFSDFRRYSRAVGSFVRRYFFDIAIAGDAFFKVEKGEDVFFQRDGKFRLDSDGGVTTYDGAALLDSGGAPIVVTPEIPVHINEAGELYQGDEKIADIALMTVDDKRWLEKVGDSRYKLTENGGEEIPGERSVIQGYLETSNVNVVAEMVEMIKVERHYEAASKAIKAYEQMDEKAISKAGNI